MEETHLKFIHGAGRGGGGMCGGGLKAVLISAELCLLTCTPMQKSSLTSEFRNKSLLVCRGQGEKEHSAQWDCQTWNPVAWTETGGPGLGRQGPRGPEI